MLIVSGTSRDENRRQLVRAVRGARMPARLVIDRSRLTVHTQSWYEYWLPCQPFFEVDTRLLHRRNRLKGAWLDVLRYPSHRECQRRYCWRYFGLLHHALRIARQERRRPDPLGVLGRIVGFECFPMTVNGEEGIAACTVTNRNPVYLLGQLRCNGAPCSPRHAQLLLPSGEEGGFYHYRQLLIRRGINQSLLLSPSVELRRRADSFIPIDRLTRLVSERPDPYWKPRARLMARRVLGPLLRAWREEKQYGANESPLNILDLGAGTGHMVAKSWHYLHRIVADGDSPSVAFHFVDANAPSFGRSFGLSREHSGVTHIEWTTADYRGLADDDQWLSRRGPFDWAFVCRVFDNASNFIIEKVGVQGEYDPECLPHRCLAPHLQPEGLSRLRVSASRQRLDGGSVLPQLSMRDYFAAMLAVQVGSVDAVCGDGCYLPVRRFNPACLITPSGRSLLAQLMKAVKAIIIEDVDVEPEHLVQHRQQFGLAGTAAVHCIRDGFTTEARQYVVTSPQWATHLRGERLW